MCKAYHIVIKGVEMCSAKKQTGEEKLKYKNLSANLSFINEIFTLAIKYLIIAYGCGFIIVNSSFYKYGFMTYDLISSRYLMAGLVFLLIIILAVLTTYLCLNQKKPYRFYTYVFTFYGFLFAVPFLLSLHLYNFTMERPLLITEILTLIFTVISFFVLLLLNIFILNMNSKIKDFVQIFSIVIIGAVILMYFSLELKIISLLFLLVSFYAGSYFQTAFNKGAQGLKNLDPLMIVMVISGILISLSAFGYYIYPKIDRLRGGGEPLKARIILASGYQNEWLKISNDYAIDFESIYILHDTPNAIFVSTDEINEGFGRAIEIQKRNILAIQYLPDEKKAFFKGKILK